MHVLDAMRARRTARAFKLRAPNRAIIESILRNAVKSPSEGNRQPWRVIVCSGDALADMVNAAVAHEASASAKPQTAAPGTAADVGMARRSGLRFFEAPVGILCLIGGDAGPGDWLDHGGFVNAIALAAMGYGVDTCIISEFRGLEEPLAQQFGIEAGERITVGIGLGYGEFTTKSASDRNPFDAIATFRWQ